MASIDMSEFTSQGQQSKLEALIEVLVLAAHADGDLSDVEREHLEKSVQSLTDGRLDDTALHSLVTAAEDAITRDGRDSRLAAVKERLPEPGARKVALGIAVQLMASDGIVRTSERELILDLAESLEVDRDEAADLVKAIEAG